MGYDRGARLPIFGVLCLEASLKIVISRHKQMMCTLERRILDAGSELDCNFSLPYPET